MKLERASRYRQAEPPSPRGLGRSRTGCAWFQQRISFEDDKTRLASYKAFQEAVEACMDLVAMMYKDLGDPPKDDYSNIENIRELQENTKKVLIEANGLRNHLVHRYSRMDDLLALESMMALLPGIEAFPAEVETWIEKRL
jgi:uncharacterized protein YutE (UPF0331/DUF86 family)